MCSAQQWPMCSASLLGSGMRKEQDCTGGPGASAMLEVTLTVTQPPSHSLRQALPSSCSSYRDMNTWTPRGKYTVHPCTHPPSGCPGWQGTSRLRNQGLADASPRHIRPIWMTGRRRSPSPGKVGKPARGGSTGAWGPGGGSSGAQSMQTRAIS